MSFPAGDIALFSNVWYYMDMNLPIISPSILSADFSDLAAGLKMIDNSGADWIHLDVMDGHFVPPITFGSKMVADIQKKTKLPLDVHLMIEKPGDHVKDFFDAGARMITFHPETCIHSHRLIQIIRDLGASPGISIVPSTTVAAIHELLPFVDSILVMTVNPGFGGQEMLPFCLRKVEELKLFRKQNCCSYKISIDGGVNLSSLDSILKVLPDILVAGSAFFAAKDPGDFIRCIRNGYAGRVVC